MEALALSEQSEAKRASLGHVIEARCRLTFHPAPGVTHTSFGQPATLETRKWGFWTQPSTDEFCHLKEVCQPYYESWFPHL